MQARVTNPGSCTIDDRLEVFNTNAAEELELSDHVVPEQWHRLLTLHRDAPDGKIQKKIINKYQ